MLTAVTKITLLADSKFANFVIWSRCLMSYFVLPSLLFKIVKNVGFSRLITSVGEERACFSAIDYSFFVVAFPEPSI